MARGRGVRLFVPEPVLEELQQRFIESIEDGRKAVRDAVKAIKKLTGAEPALPQLDEQTLLRAYTERVAATLASLHLERIPVTTVTAAEIFGHAVRRGKPFHATGSAKDAGFKDAVILRSVCDHVRTERIARAIFVSADTDHEKVQQFDPAIANLAIRSLTAALDVYQNGLFTVEAVNGYVERIRVAGQSATADLPTITAFVLSELQNATTRTELLGVTDVRSASPVIMEALDLFPGMADVQIGDPVEVTLLGIFELRVLVQRKEPEKLLPSASSREQLIELLAARATEAEDTRLVPLEIEAVAERTADGYRNFQPRSARVVELETMSDDAAKRFSRRMLGKD